MTVTRTGRARRPIVRWLAIALAIVLFGFVTGGLPLDAADATTPAIPSGTDYRGRVVTAYATVFAVIFVYLFIAHRRARRVEKELPFLEQRLSRLEGNESDD